MRPAALTLLLLVLAAACSAPAGSGPVDPWLAVAQDESSVELQVREYLAAEHDIEGRTGRLGEGASDLALRVALPCLEAPDIAFVIDTEPTVGEDEPREVLERVVLVTSYHEIPRAKRTPEVRARILELNARYARTTWMPHRIYLDDGWSLVMESAVNIPRGDVRVHAEQVYDVLARTATTWEDYHAELTRILGE